MLKRDRNIAWIGLGAVAAVVVIFVFVLPTFQEWSDLENQIRDKNKELLDKQTRVSTAKSLEKTWAAWQVNGLQLLPSDGDAKVLAQLQNWMVSLNLPPVISVQGEPAVENASKSKQYLAHRFQVKFKGGMKQIATLLAYMQAAELPLRINDMTMRPTPENSNTIDVNMTVATTYVNPAAGRPTAAPAAASTEIP
jgi:hypothetical protein